VPRDSGLFLFRGSFIICDTLDVLYRVSSEA
jgi:hypothetical protein